MINTDAIDIEIAEVYAGEITPDDNYPEATIISMDEGTLDEGTLDEGRGVILCILFVILVVCIFFIIYILLKMRQIIS